MRARNTSSQPEQKRKRRHPRGLLEQARILPLARGSGSWLQGPRPLPNHGAALTNNDLRRATAHNVRCSAKLDSIGLCSGSAFQAGVQAGTDEPVPKPPSPATKGDEHHATPKTNPRSIVSILRERLRLCRL